MRLLVTGVVAVGTCFLSGCRDGESARGGDAPAAIESVYTDLRDAACQREIDTSDPNETPYFVCPGVEGYSLIVRRVGSGRRSIDVVTAARDTFPLRIDEVITRHMLSLGDSAEWRVRTTGATRDPVALIVRVDAREDGDDPSRVTQTWWAVARIAANEACITDRIADGERPATAVRDAADTARERPCAQAQPALSPGDAAVR